MREAQIKGEARTELGVSLSLWTALSLWPVVVLGLCRHLLLAGNKIRSMCRPSGAISLKLDTKWKESALLPMTCAPKFRQSIHVMPPDAFSDLLKYLFLGRRKVCGHVLPGWLHWTRYLQKFILTITFRQCSNDGTLITRWLLCRRPTVCAWMYHGLTCSPVQQQRLL